MSPEQTLASRVLGRPDVSQREVDELIELDMGFEVKELSISAGETRQIRQYEPNTYHVVLKYDLTKALEVLAVKVMQSEDKVARYFELKKVLFQLISDRYSNGENYLRDLMKKQQEADGIKR